MQLIKFSLIALLSISFVNAHNNTNKHSDDNFSVDNKINMVDNKINMVDNKINMKDNKINMVDNKINMKDNKINMEDNKINMKDNKINMEDNKINMVDNKINIAVNIDDNITRRSSEFTTTLIDDNNTTRSEDTIFSENDNHIGIDDSGHDLFPTYTSSLITPTLSVDDNNHTKTRVSLPINNTIKNSINILSFFQCLYFFLF